MALGAAYLFHLNADPVTVHVAPGQHYTIPLSFALLAAIGVGTEQGIAFGMLLFLIIVLDSLIGGLLFLFQQMLKPAAAQSAGQAR